MYRRKHKQERSKDKSTKMMHIRLTEEEYEAYKDRAAMLGATLSGYVRQLLRTGKYEITVQNILGTEDIKAIAAEYGKIGSNINQIAHHLNTGLSWSRTLLEEMKKNLSDMEKETRKLSKVVMKINGDNKTSDQQKFTL